MIAILSPEAFAAKIDAERAEYARRVAAAEQADAAHAAEDAAKRYRQQVEWETSRHYLHLLDAAKASGKRADLEAAWSLWQKMSESERILTRVQE
jgi:hypothetical protein